MNVSKVYFESWGGGLVGKKGLLCKYGYGNLSWEPWRSRKIRCSGVCDSALGGKTGTSSLCLARNLSPTDWCLQCRKVRCVLREKCKHQPATNPVIYSGDLPAWYASVVVASMLSG